VPKNKEINNQNKLKNKDSIIDSKQKKTEDGKKEEFDCNGYYVMKKYG